jgi:hypothetical protein
MFRLDWKRSSWLAERNVWNIKYCKTHNSSCPHCWYSRYPVAHLRKCWKVSDRTALIKERNVYSNGRLCSESVDSDRNGMPYSTPPSGNWPMGRSKVVCKLFLWQCSWRSLWFQQFEHFLEDIHREYDKMNRNIFLCGIVK